jgi:predicted ATP-dependent serine protease
MLLYEIMAKNTTFADDVMKEAFDPISTGLKSLDNAVGKFKQGEAIIITSIDPITGTAFILDLALKNAAGHRIPTFLLSSITSTEQMAKWVFLGMDDFQVIPRNTPLYIEDAGNLSIEGLKQRIIELKQSSLIEVVIIDSIDYIYQALPAEKGQRITSLYEYIRGVKQLAKKLNIIIVMTARAIKDIGLPKEIAIAEPLVDLLINIEMLESYEDQNKRMIIVNKNGEDIASILVMFDRKHARYYDEGESYEPPIYKEEIERERSIKCNK